MTKRVLITGTSGFVGSAVAKGFLNRQWQVAAAYRSIPVGAPEQIEPFFVGDFLDQARWTQILQGVDVLVHCAARVHVMREADPDPIAAFRSTNVQGTKALALAALKAGVRRFVYLSSAKVNGESTGQGRKYSADQATNPVDPYAISKFEAEICLREISQSSSLETVIIRPPLVYGPRVKANFYKMMLWLHRGIPLPFGGLANQRSLVALDNLVDLIATVAESPAAANQTFLVSDDEDLSTSDLLHRLGLALRRPARLFHLPPSLVSAAARLLGQQSALERLFGSLQLDITKTKAVLDWRPPVSVRYALEITAEDFLAGRRRR